MLADEQLEFLMNLLITVLLSQLCIDVAYMTHIFNFNSYQSRYLHPQIERFLNIPCLQRQIWFDSWASGKKTN